MPLAKPPLFADPKVTEVDAAPPLPCTMTVPDIVTDDAVPGVPKYVDVPPGVVEPPPPPPPPTAITVIDVTHDGRVIVYVFGVRRSQPPLQQEVVL